MHEKNDVKTVEQKQYGRVLGSVCRSTILTASTHSKLLEAIKYLQFSPGHKPLPIMKPDGIAFLERDSVLTHTLNHSMVSCHRFGNL